MQENIIFQFWVFALDFKLCALNMQEMLWD